MYTQLTTLPDFPYPYGIIHNLPEVNQCQLQNYQDRGQDGHKQILSQDNETVSVQQKRVLVITYQRSGSTLAGDLLQQVTNSSYVFEPLRYIEEDIVNGNVVTFLNKTGRSYKKSDSIYVMAEMVFNWFTCNVQNINTQDLTSIMLSYSDAYGEYSRCVSKADMDVNKTMGLINRCLKFLMKPCHSNNVTIIKTIRLDMASVALLLKWLPGLKVVHLLRDPRGRLSSELKIDRQKWSSIQSIASLHCNQMLSDILIAERLNKQYPDTIRILQYESFTNDSIQQSNSLFRFLNLEFTLQIRKYVEFVTLQTDVVDICYWCVKKTNAKLTSSKWRLTIEEKHARQIDMQCGKLYDTVGFLKIKDSRSLRNLSVPLQTNKLKYMSL
ncbi:carbohydrate sulfotransferase 3-like isoform X2 [Argopecten irradians]|uniref:carbohydrate sulfotransferase 3-like isoform X2 n=1 Tax=Argopecten irradians TaxID=31199 RepID=UPI003716E765